MNYYGAWNDALRAAGLDPAVIRRDASLARRQGNLFENLCRALFALIRPDWAPGRNTRIRGRMCRPDAVEAGARTWIDFKLTAWGDSASGTLLKYVGRAPAIRIIVLEGERTDSRAQFRSVFDYVADPIRAPLPTGLTRAECAAHRRRQEEERARIVAALHALRPLVLPVPPHGERSGATPGDFRMHATWARKWNVERLIAALQQLPPEHLPSSIAERHHPGLHKQVVDEFTAWPIGLWVAGYQPNEIMRRAAPSTREQVAQYIVDHVNEPSAFTSATLDQTSEGRRFHRGCLTHHRGIREALEANGVSPASQGLKPLVLGLNGWIERLRRHATDGRPLTPTALERGGSASRLIYRELLQRHPGGYPGALRAIGIDPATVYRRPNDGTRRDAPSGIQTLAHPPSRAKQTRPAQVPGDRGVGAHAGRPRRTRDRRAATSPGKVGRSRPGSRASRGNR